MILTSKVVNKTITTDQKLRLFLSFHPNGKEVIDKRGKTCRIEIYNYDINYGTVLDKVYFHELGTLPTNVVLDIDIFHLKPGVYCVEKVLLFNNQDINIHKSVFADFYETKHLLFQILDNTSDSISLERMKGIQTKAHQINMRGIGIKTEKTLEYIGYAFCKDVYIGKHLDLGECTIEPYNRLGNEHIRKMMFEYFEMEYTKVNPSPRENTGSAFDDPYKTPIVVVKYQKIHAESVKDAGDILHKYTNEVLRALSLINDSYGFILGDLIVHKNNKYQFTVSDRTYINSYMGNLFVGMENNRKIQQIIRTAQSDDKKSFYLQLYIDCSKEKRRKYSYFKFWNLLETIARNMNYVGQPLKDINNQIVLNHRGNERKIRNVALELVFELIRRTCESQNKQFILGENLNISSLSNLLTVFYQRRNCIAHRGGCQFNNPDICDTRNTKKRICREALFEMKQKSNNPDNFVDEYLFKLKNITAEIVRYELGYY